MEEKIKVLILEDVLEDLELVLFELRQAEIKFTHLHVETGDGYRKGLVEFKPDLILSDYNLPQFNGMEALLITKEIAPLIPFIIVTGSLNEEIAVNCIKSGAWDYVLKENLVRLGPAVTQSLERKALIDKKKKAEVELQENLLRYRLAQQIGHVGNWEYSLETEHFWGSKEAKRIYGFDPEAIDFTSAEVESCIPDRENVHQALLDLIENEVPYDLEFEIKTKDKGESKFIHSIAILEKDEKGKPLKVSGVIHDITESKIAKDTLQESEERLKDAQRIAKIGNWILDLATGKVFVSDMMLNLIRINKSEVLDVSEHEKYYTPESWQRFQMALKDTRENGRSYKIELEFADKDAECRYAIARGEAVYDKNNNLIGLKGTLQDITERKKSEMALKESEEFNRQIIASSYDSIILLDLQGNLIFISEGGQKLMEIDDTSSVINRSWLDFWKGEDSKYAVEALAQAKQGSLGSFYGYCPSQKGTPKHWDVLISPICNIEGKVNQLLAVSRDVTESKRAEEALKKRMQELEIFYEAAVGRELKINEHREEINELLEKMGKKPKYKIVV